MCPIFWGRELVVFGTAYGSKEAIWAVALVEAPWSKKPHTSGEVVRLYPPQQPMIRDIFFVLFTTRRLICGFVGLVYRR